MIWFPTRPRPPPALCLHKQPSNLQFEPAWTRTPNIMEDATGRVGDELDVISLRDIAAVRYVRHHEWLELVLGTAVSTEKITAPKISIGGNNTNVTWTRDDADQLASQIAQLDKDIKDLEAKQARLQAEATSPSCTDTAALYKRLTAKLQDDFGKVPSDLEEYQQNIIKELEAAGKTVVDKRRIKIVKEPEPVAEQPIEPEIMPIESMEPEPVGQSAGVDSTAQPDLGPDNSMQDLDMGDGPQQMAPPDADGLFGHQPDSNPVLHGQEMDMDDLLATTHQPDMIDPDNQPVDNNNNNNMMTL